MSECQIPQLPPLTSRAGHRRSHALTPPSSSRPYSRYIGRVGALALALGIGLATGHGLGIARADGESDDADTSTTETGSTPDSTDSDDGAAGTAQPTVNDVTTGTTAPQGTGGSESQPGHRRFIRTARPGVVLSTGGARTGRHRAPTNSQVGADTETSTETSAATERLDGHRDRYRYRNPNRHKRTRLGHQHHGT